MAVLLHYTVRDWVATVVALSVAVAVALVAGSVVGWPMPMGIGIGPAATGTLLLSVWAKNQVAHR